jgi:RNA polymerase sigma-70 factor (ECF subfamily)
MITDLKIGAARRLEPRETAPSIEDALRLKRLCLGDVAALQALIDAYWRPLLNYAARILDDRDAAEDTVQDGFIRLWERRREWEPNAPARVILYTIVRNLALNGRKSVKLRNRSDVRLRVPRPTAPTAPEDAVQADELDAAMRAAIDALPPRRREVLLLAKFDGLSRNEIAELLGIAPQTIANHLALALAELRDLLRPFLAS